MVLSCGQCGTKASVFTFRVCSVLSKVTLLLSAHTRTSQYADMHGKLHGKLRSCIIWKRLKTRTSYLFHPTSHDSAILATFFTGAAVRDFSSRIDAIIRAPPRPSQTTQNNASTYLRFPGVCIPLIDPSAAKRFHHSTNLCCKLDTLFGSSPLTVQSKAARFKPSTKAAARPPISPACARTPPTLQYLTSVRPRIAPLLNKKVVGFFFCVWHHFSAKEKSADSANDSHQRICFKSMRPGWGIWAYQFYHFLHCCKGQRDCDANW